MWTVERGRIVIGICKITEGIERVLNGALNIVKPVIEIALCETVVREGLLELKESLIGELWVKGSRRESTPPFILESRHISTFSASFLTLGSKHESK